METTYLAVGILICLGIYTVISTKNLIKMVIGISIVESALILLLIFVGYRPQGTVPILDHGYDLVVDPVPQALALTAIVIGASTTALMLALVVKLYKRYDTLDVSKIRKLRG
ncbi:sodium:proton antiporter [Fuchsiella alkaliacetigena]|uniref:sodium:proton antiporter n=1 Tax=Fuchsiella alkaliacetigena TaxID=957042 RepID=UPI00200B63C4|nr:cation:proton antiporter subunit C [Fuchsiella alkaliacetigena]MCK8825636.1 cation:proton antiporter subunit C [Fuchsiella alkaliacetigena]